ncbi:hypothetical protein HDU67_004872 [Dinochytrium kinnereticum]|nr:hypothetical protein HDU67_004872 [Dinochytrium kinnereticum]
MYQKSEHLRKLWFIRRRHAHLSEEEVSEALKDAEGNELDSGANVEDIFEGWSTARVKAYQAVGTSPNAYYYRFNAPGEKQKNGPWTEDEKRLFMARLSESGSHGQWGLFSTAIPGRVGYQLLKSGEIKDQNYVVDEKGSLRYLFTAKDGTGKSFRYHKRHRVSGEDGSDGPSSSDCKRTTTTKRVRVQTNQDRSNSVEEEEGEEETTTRKSLPPPSTKRGVKRRRRRRVGSEDEEEEEEDEDEDEEYGGAIGRRRRRRRPVMGVEGLGKPENPLPGFVDPITLDEVVKPALSPYGHVMSYDTWMKCLGSKDSRNVCPLTKQPLTKRQLVILTFENIEENRHRIIN